MVTNRRAGWDSHPETAREDVLKAEKRGNEMLPTIRHQPTIPFHAKGKSNCAQRGVKRVVKRGSEKGGCRRRQLRV